MLRHFNNAFQHFIMPATEAIVVILGSASLYMLVSFGKKMPIMITIISLGSAALSLLIEALGFSVAGKINKNSKLLVRNLLCKRNQIKSKADLKKLLSLREMKIMFGYSNFMEVRTCLEFLDFTANCTSTLLITFKRS